MESVEKTKKLVYICFYVGVLMHIEFDKSIFSKYGKRCRPQRPYFSCSQVLVTNIVINRDRYAETLISISIKPPL